jgi:putative flavoprotein involved in K+ transport
VGSGQTGCQLSEELHESGREVFRPDYTHWVRFPAFDAMGFPLTDNGTSTVVPGLYFCGVHFLRKRKSSVLFGVGEDAAIVAQSIAHHRSRHHTALLDDGSQQVN